MTTETKTAEKKTFFIPTECVETLAKRIKALSRKAKKLGADLPSFKILDEVTRKVGKVEARFFEVEITGPIVQVSGWNFVASIDHAGEAGNAIRKVPGYEGDVPRKYREGGPTCDHCNLDRRRNDSFLCTDGEGNWKQVGRNCLGDFIGRNPEHLVWGLEFWTGIDSNVQEWSAEGGGRLVYSVRFQDFLSATAYYIRTEGWISVAKARASYDDTCSTASAAWSLATAPADNKWAKSEWARVTDSDRETATEALKWTNETLSDKNRSDYEQNLYIALSKAGVVAKDTGIVASLFLGYNRHIEAEINRKRQAEKSNEYLWTEGERVKDVTLTLISRRSFESDYGSRVLHMFEDEAGNSLKWWGSDYFTDKDGVEADLGDKVSASWTVKKHEEYKNRKITVINRPARKKVFKTEEKE